MPETAATPLHNLDLTLAQAESLLAELARVSFATDFLSGGFLDSLLGQTPPKKTAQRPDAEARYRTLVEQIPAVIFMAFLDEGVSEAYVSPHIETVLGFTQEEWLRNPVLWYRQIHPEDQGRWNVEAAQLVLSGQPLRAVYRVIARDGHVVWFHCQVKMIFADDGRPWFVHGTAFDISDLKRAEQALQNANDELETRVRERTAELEKANADLRLEIAERRRAESQLAVKAEELARSNADLEQFAYSASHDLQEPLRNVAIYSQWLRERYQGKLDAKADQFIGFVNEGAHRMAAMIRDLLSYTQIANGTEDEDEEIDANVPLANAMESVEASVRESQATITHDPLPRVRIREVHLQQLFQNLLSNAIKYRSDEPPRIHVSANRSNDEWLFSVRDNGIGIAAEYHDKVFGIFKRLHDSRRYSGTGIGLALCKRIVERRGGRIWVESELDRGAVFYFTLP